APGGAGHNDNHDSCAGILAIAEAAKAVSAPPPPVQNHSNSSEASLDTGDSDDKESDAASSTSTSTSGLCAVAVAAVAPPGSALVSQTSSRPYERSDVSSSSPASRKLPLPHSDDTAAASVKKKGKSAGVKRRRPRKSIGLKKTKKVHKSPQTRNGTLA